MTGKARTCATCDNMVRSLNGSGQRFCIGPQRLRYNSIDGFHTVSATVEYERFWLWRKMRFDTCGPEGDFWTPLPPRPSPPPAADYE